MTEYSQWFFNDGWIFVTALGAGLGFAFGLRAYLVIIPLVAAAVFWM